MDAKIIITLLGGMIGAVDAAPAIIAPVNSFL